MRRAIVGSVLAIEATGVTKVYAGFFGRNSGQTALAGLDIAIAKGAAFGLIGQNGAGKTTFIKTLLGIVRPSSGGVRVLGGEPEDPKVRAKIGYLPERLFLTNSFTPRQFLASVARMKGLSMGDKALRFQLERVGLGADSNRKIGGFSKGMRQRLGLAAALLGEPELLVLDEPTDGVDPLGRADIRELLAEERARGVTLFLNSHLLSETERVCDRIGILAGGRLIREGALQELRGSETAFVATFAEALDPGVLAPFGFVATDDPLTFRVEAESPAVLNEKLDAARRAGALLLTLARNLRDLEDVLTEALGPRRPKGTA